MTGITADVRFAMRALWRHRGFTIAVVLTLAVGVGVTSAVFHVYRAALLRPLAVSEPEGLVFLHRFETRRGYYSSASYPAFIDYRERAADLVDFAAYTTAMTTARRHVDAALSQEWLAATAATAIAALALVLAIVGLYGIVRYTVAQRTREIGIRVALGATPRAIVTLALGDAAWTLVPGAAAGLAALVPVALMIRPLLHNVRPFDAAVLAASIALTAACALAAVWIPARAAGRIDPADALRLE